MLGKNVSYLKGSLAREQLILHAFTAACQAICARTQEHVNQDVVYIHCWPTHPLGNDHDDQIPKQCIQEDHLWNELKHERQPVPEVYMIEIRHQNSQVHLQHTCNGREHESCWRKSADKFETYTIIQSHTVCKLLIKLMLIHRHTVSNYRSLIVCLYLIMLLEILASSTLYKWCCKSKHRVEKNSVSEILKGKPSL